jgi:uncharacterized membrane protein YgcG
MAIPEVSETEIITMEDLEIREDSVIRIHSQDQTNNYPQQSQPRMNDGGFRNNSGGFNNSGGGGFRSGGSSGGGFRSGGGGGGFRGGR